MLGISYGELLLLLGATAALIGPKDLPKITRTAGILAGRAIGYVQLARGQFETVMQQQSQARQVHKELQDAFAQLDAIRHEIRSISIVNPGPLTRRLDNLDHTSNAVDAEGQKEIDSKDNLRPHIIKGSGLTISHPCNFFSQATTFAKLAESLPVKNDQMESSNEIKKNDQEANQLTVLPVSAETAGLLPNRKADAKGSDIMLDAILEAEVAHSAKEFCLKLENQILSEGDS